jgi:hypothetical protein
LRDRRAGAFGVVQHYDRRLRPFRRRRLVDHIGSGFAIDRDLIGGARRGQRDADSKQRGC